MRSAKGVYHPGKLFFYLIQLKEILQLLSIEIDLSNPFVGQDIFSNHLPCIASSPAHPTIVVSTT